MNNLVERTAAVARPHTLSTSPTDIETALQCISPDVDRDTWVRVGMALQHELGEAGFDLFNTWSSNGQTYQAMAAKSAWRSFKPGGNGSAITIATLFQMARDNGYKPLSNGQPYQPTRKSSKLAVTDADIADERRSGLSKAQKCWDSGKSVASHPYAQSKGVNPEGMRVLGKTLLIPLYNVDQQISSIQRIKPDGEKRFLKGCSASGCYFQIGELSSHTLVIVEGWATGMSIQEATGFAVVVAFSSGNLAKVTGLMRSKRPDSKIVIAPDNDQSQHAIKKAEAAARKFDCQIVIPKFPEGTNGTDFNDLYLTAGLDEVKRQFEDQRSPSEDATDPCTDLANAQRLVADCKDDFMFIEGNGPHRWDGKSWQRDPMEGKRRAQRIGRLVAQESAKLLNMANDEDSEQPRKQLLKESGALTNWAKSSESRQRIEAALSLAEPHLTVPAKQINADPMLLCLQNGTLNLRTNTLYEHRREDFITKYIDIPYDPQATCPLWEETMLGIFESNPLIDYFQRFCGYCLTAKTREHVMLILWGVGKNGKSTIVNTMRTVLGPYAITGAPDLLMQTSRARHSELADLFGARAVSVAETPQSGKLNENLVKQITGGDPIKGRHNYGQFFEFLPTHKLWVMTNHLPGIQGCDMGIWRRIHLLPFNRVIPEDQRDKHREEKLQAELPGILCWMVEGCKQWQQQGLNPPVDVLNATEAYKSEQDTFQEFFEEKCELRGQVTFAKIYQTYSNWCRDNGEKPESRRWVADRLTDRSLVKRKTSTGPVYQGIQIRESGQPNDRYER